MKIVFFTGAGISKESGLSTYRDTDGVWKEYDPKEVCSLRGYNKNREKVLEFHNKVRSLIDAVEPNAAHKAIADLEKDHDVVVVTQNIDNLHERAGSSNVIKVHGDIYTARLKRYKVQTLPWSEDITTKSHPEGWEKCIGTMRHDVVMFGEKPKHISKAREETSTADMIVVVGTSLEVYPAANLVLDANRTKRILINFETTIHDEIFDVEILGKATEKVPEFCRTITDDETTLKR